MGEDKYDDEHPMTPGMTDWVSRAAKDKHASEPGQAGRQEADTMQFGSESEGGILFGQNNQPEFEPVPHVEPLWLSATSSRANSFGASDDDKEVVRDDTAHGAHRRKRDSGRFGNLFGGIKQSIKQATSTMGGTTERERLGMLLDRAKEGDACGCRLLVHTLDQFLRDTSPSQTRQGKLWFPRPACELYVGPDDQTFWIDSLERLGFETHHLGSDTFSWSILLSNAPPQTLSSLRSEIETWKISFLFTAKSFLEKQTEAYFANASPLGNTILKLLSMARQSGGNVILSDADAGSDLGDLRSGLHTLGFFLQHYDSHMCAEVWRSLFVDKLDELHSVVLTTRDRITGAGARGVFSRDGRLVTLENALTKTSSGGSMSEIVLKGFVDRYRNATEAFPFIRGLQSLIEAQPSSPYLLMWRVSDEYLERLRAKLDVFPEDCFYLLRQIMQERRTLDGGRREWTLPDGVTDRELSRLRDVICKGMVKAYNESAEFGTGTIENTDIVRTRPTEFGSDSKSRSVSFNGGERQGTRRSRTFFTKFATMCQGNCRE